MDRRDFLSQLGIGAGFVLATACLGSCKSDAVTPADFTLNLDDAANAALKVNGGYIISNGTVVARTNAGTYVAATVVCSHEQKNQVTYRKSSDSYYCTAHGAEFDLKGKGLNSNGSKGLTVYQTALTGTSLRVFS
jgi:nitrite reductase/ring-hydroxylating ferredoxin subunit